MSHFQVTAIMGNGAAVLFGVVAEDRAGALALARTRLSWSGHAVERAEVTLVNADPIARLSASRPEPGR